MPLTLVTALSVGYTNSNNHSLPNSANLETVQPSVPHHGGHRSLLHPPCVPIQPFTLSHTTLHLVPSDPPSGLLPCRPLPCERPVQYHTLYPLAHYLASDQRLATTLRRHCSFATTFLRLPLPCGLATTLRHSPLPRGLATTLPPATRPYLAAHSTLYLAASPLPCDRH